MSLTAPELLASHHDLTDFACGNIALDDWLKLRSFTNQTSGATRTFVICKDNKVVGYYALASGGISSATAVDKFRRNMPNPIPVVILARLAIDSSCQGRGLGRALFRDAGLRIDRAADTVGIRGIVVHAISAEAKNFYVALGFNESPIEPMTLMITLNDLRACMID
ncbi:GNAT family N-acetyltransferase [Chamaesiphon sp.]|uniref:GNAT family N-acetyltransferase n=1 Tax=Chamaesiphon sp. TaxID=2814140 RepID=UPI00359318E0